MDRYFLVNFVFLDRGLIPTGETRNDVINSENNFPYPAGTVIQSKGNYRRYFLDEFNSEILLRDFLGYTSSKFIGVNLNPTLSQILNDNESVFQQYRVGIVTVPDLDTFLRRNGIIKMHKSASLMHEIAKTFSILNF